MNKKTIEGLKKIHEGLGLIISSLEQTPETVSVATTVEAAVADVVADSEEEEEASGDSDLNSLSYTDLKALAKKLGLPARGERAEIISRIQEANGAVSAPAAKVTSITPAEPAAPVEEEDVDPLYTEVMESVAELSNEELADILVEAKLSAKGKREALLHRIYEGVKSGAIQFDSEEDSEESPAPVEDDDSSEDSGDVNYNVVEGMTKERKKALEGYLAENRTIIESGELTEEEIREWLSSYDVNGELGLDTLEGEDLIEAYLYYSSLLISDEGDIVEEGAYTITDVAFCCAHPLEYDEDNSQYVCEVCGTAYAAEEE